jgi:membrane protease YdiL (CAAX protease family)
MRENTFERSRALLLATALVGLSFVLPRTPMRWRVPAQAGVGALLIPLTGSRIGLCPPRLWAGLRWGLAAGAAAAAAIAVTAPMPVVRLSMSARQLPRTVPAWLGLQIPVGTVWAEEAAFRAALATAAGSGFGKSGGRLVQAVAFGLSHIADARATGQPVTPTILATGAAGWLFSWLADRSGSLAAPMLAHLAINETAAAAALTIQRRSGR